MTESNVNCIDIGVDRCMTVHANASGIIFTKFHPQPGGGMRGESFALSAFAVKTIQQNWRTIESAVGALQDKKLEDAYQLPLGRQVFLDPQLKQINERGG